ncbi:caspase domain-containing protein [Mycena olivaceomarginata]|nr:caspase domain-containing protein [Mycena olivaceomarginata]
MTPLIVTDQGKGCLKAQTPLSITEVPSECAPSSISSPLRPTVHKKALLIGICNHQTSAAPGGEHDDVYKMRDLLLDVYHYALSDITILINDGIEGHVQPTCENILAAAAELVKDVKDGDQLCFHYAGHSTQLSNELSSCEEGDNGMMHRDGCLGPVLYDTLVRPLPSGSHLVAVLDTCHSGSLLDLKHFRCNRVYVPWVFRGDTDGIWNTIARRNARLMTKAIPQTNGPGFQKHNAPTSIAYAGTQRNKISPPSMSSPPLFGVGGSASAWGGRISKSGSLARLRTGGKGSLAPLRTLSLSVPSAAKTKGQDKNEEQLELPRTFSEEEAAHCESPVGELLCDGWCRKPEWPVAEEGDEVKADVVSLTSSQKAWEMNGVSMTSLLVDLLREAPHQPVKDVLVRISHIAYSLGHSRSKAYKKQCKTYAAKEEIGVIPQEKRYDWGRFRNPELESSLPLDMNTAWKM